VKNATDRSRSLTGRLTKIFRDAVVLMAASVVVRFGAM